MADVIALKKTSWPCGGCKYLGWQGLVIWCRHPAHLEAYQPRRAFAILAAGGKCRSYIEWETMVPEGHEPKWPMPVSLLEVTHG
jgi:hypothetical protein